MHALLISVIFVVAVVFSSCTRPQKPDYAIVAETQPRFLLLDGPTADRSSQISGLAWCGDRLILLPQYPAFPSRGGNGVLFSLHKDEILSALQSGASEPLQPAPIPIDAPDFSNSKKGFEGYEAIVFGSGKDSLLAWLAVEVEPEEGKAYGLIMKGKMGEGFLSFSVDTSLMVQIPSQSGVGNMAEEALVITDGGNRILSFHEANHVLERDPGVVHCFDATYFNECGQVSLPQLPYRITDATALDDSGKFWVINMFYPGEEELFVQEDPVARTFGIGISHKGHKKVERILELTADSEGISFSESQKPIYLSLTDPLMESRNWEGIARLDTLGLLMITDTYPETMLAFIPFH